MRTAQLLLVALFFGTPAKAQDTAFRFELPQCDGCTWFKGNTHTHTTESDGDSSPEYVAGWYKDHGYDFLVLSDHNFLVDPASLSQLVDDTFLLIPGEEVTSSFGDAAVHVNGLNLHEVAAPQTRETLVATIQANVDVVRDHEGLPHINHPNYGWSLGPQELAQVERYNLLEIFNGHPSVHNQAGGGYPGMEEVWDILLTKGKRIYGIAVDDAHHFQGEFSQSRVNPGRGWVVVKAAALEANAIMEALEEGRFYASTGVELEDVVVGETRFEIRIRAKGSFKYTTTFIGEGGRVLEIVHGPVAEFRLAGPEPFVRAVVQDSGGYVAWVQPVFVGRN
jgi:predicted metal-dependent phosphoesterase TrpH